MGRQPVAQALARSRQPRHHGADRHAGDGGDFAVTKALECDQQQHLALIVGNLRQLRDDIGEIDLVFLRRLAGQGAAEIFEADRAGPACATWLT